MKLLLSRVGSILQKSNVFKEFVIEFTGFDTGLSQKITFPYLSTFDVF